MSDVRLQGIYSQKQREFSTQNVGGTGFSEDFICATNNAVGWINALGNPASVIATVEDVSDTVTNLAVAYTFVLSSGISRELLQLGRRPAKGMAQMVAAEAAKFEDAIAAMQTRIRNIAQDADTDDSSTDTIGLGHLG